MRQIFSQWSGGNAVEGQQVLAGVRQHRLHGRVLPAQDAGDDIAHGDDLRRGGRQIVAELLGHTSVVVTRTIYSHVLKERAARAAALRTDLVVGADETDATVSARQPST